MGCAPSGASTGLGVDGLSEIIIEVPDMPADGGWTHVMTPDGIKLEFHVPFGYPPKTKIKTRYKAVPKPKPAPKPKAKAKAKATGSTADSPSPGTEDTTTPLTTPEPPKPPQTVEVRIVHEMSNGFPVLPTQLPKWNGSWDWIRHENDDVSRATRKDAGELLVETFKKGGFAIKGSGAAAAQVVRYKCIAKMIQGTKILSCGQKLPPLGVDPKRKLEMQYGQGITPMEKAKTLVSEGYKPSCVNAASAFHAGGGFSSGGRHALEEAFCNQSTLYESLQKAQALWKVGESSGIYRNEAAGHFHQHIPTDGCIMSPCVEIFRGNSDQGYMCTHKDPTQVASVVSIAMYNKNYKMNDAPCDAPKDEKEYEEGVRKKFTAMAHGAALSGADAIIIPDVGCGVFMNDPKVVGRICGEVLFNYNTRFRRAVFTGNEDFYKAATEGFKVASGTGAPPVTADQGLRSCLTPLNADAHKIVGNCVICKRSLAGSNFGNLAILIDTAKKTHEMQFLHGECGAEVPKKFPGRRVMMLPDITSNAKSFLSALDLNGNGMVEKQEIKCVCALLWDGDVAKESDKFEKEFEAHFATWDADKSGNVDLKQITGVAPVAGQADKNAKPGGFQRAGSLTLGNQTCIQYVQAQAKKKALKR